MSSADIQAVVDARTASVADDYMDDHAINKLKTDLLEDVRAKNVEVVRDMGDNALHVKVFVGPHVYESCVKLSKRVVRLLVTPPSAFGDAVVKNDLPDDVRETHAKKHAADEQKKADADAKDAADAQADADKAAKADQKAQAKADKS